MDENLASQPTLSRLLSLLSTAKNHAHLCTAVLKLALDHLWTRNGERRLSTFVADVDSMPSDAHGNQRGSKYNGHYKKSVFLPQFVTCGKTGDERAIAKEQKSPKTSPSRNPVEP